MIQNMGGVTVHDSFQYGKVGQSDSAVWSADKPTPLKASFTVWFWDKDLWEKLQCDTKDIRYK